MAESTTTPTDPFLVKTKARERKERILEYLGEMLIPVTEGFDHINLDLSFTYLGNFDLEFVRDKCMAITMCSIYGLKQSEYLLRGDLAAFLNARRSRNAKSMDLFTTVVTKTDTQFTDKTDKKEGFSFFKNIGRKKEEK